MYLQCEMREEGAISEKKKIICFLINVHISFHILNSLARGAFLSKRDWIIRNIYMQGTAKRKPHGLVILYFEIPRFS